MTKLDIHKLNGEQKPTHRVVVASSTLVDTAAAIEEVLDALEAEAAALTFVFFDRCYDAEIIARVLDRRTQERGIGGTTAGEISNAGFRTGSITAMSLHGEDVRASVEIVAQLRRLSLVPLVSLPHKLAEGIGRSLDELSADRHMWISLIDGLSGKEDLFVPFFVQAARRVPLIGGSLSDGEHFCQVFLVHHGRVYSDAAAVVLLEYPYGFQPIHHTHLVFSEHWLTVTRVSEGGRVIEMLDGMPAHLAFAHAMGVSPHQVTTGLTGRYPLGYRFRGRPFPYSIMQTRDDGSFGMAHSVQVGERLNILMPQDLTDQSARAIEEAIGQLEQQTPGRQPQALLLFNCLGRYFEAKAQGMVGELFEAIHQAPVCGFNTYGEQFTSMHMNHSLTGVVFG
ncbi:MAG: FIST C-terminal domain-containing protein [Bradymonadaceae bacterium]|nr:FIST C-terminal domain-containing protein [Lujinxingiaceae bacterium]